MAVKIKGRLRFAHSVASLFRAAPGPGGAGRSAQPCLQPQHLAKVRWGGYRKHVLKPHRAFIVERLHQTPRLSLHGLKDELETRGSRSHPAWTGSRAATLSSGSNYLALDECQHVRVQCIGIGGEHAVRIAWIDLQGSIPQQLHGKICRRLDRDDLVIIAMQDESGHRNLLEVLGLLGFREHSPVIMGLCTANHALALSGEMKT